MWKEEIPEPEPQVSSSCFKVGDILNYVRVKVTPSSTKNPALHFVNGEIGYCKTNDGQIVTEVGRDAAKLAALIAFRDFAVAQIPILDAAIAATRTVEPLAALHAEATEPQTA